MFKLSKSPTAWEPAGRIYKSVEEVDAALALFDDADWAVPSTACLPILADFRSSGVTSHHVPEGWDLSGMR